MPKVLARMMALSGPPPLMGADDSFRAAVQAQHNTLQTFYGAALDAYRGDRDAWADDIRSVMHDDGENPYYRWFVGNDG
ncbi:MAG: hypothetical protein WCA85_21075 [Paraburkholderia sp.]